MVPVVPRSKADTAVWSWLMVLAALLAGAADAAAQEGRAARGAVHVVPLRASAPAQTAPTPDAQAPTAPVLLRATPGGWPRLRIADPVGRQNARKALDLAWQRLADADCANAAERLRTLAVDLPTYLTMVVFIDGSRETPCVTGVFAFTAPGSRVVRLCVEEVKRTWEQDPEHALASFVHEMLHTLGVGEDPPSSAEITRRILMRCRQRR
jgi:hypothetical protein